MARSVRETFIAYRPAITPLIGEALDASKGEANGANDQAVSLAGLKVSRPSPVIR
jgi:hypothetical protein